MLLIVLSASIAHSGCGEDSVSPVLKDFGVHIKVRCAQTQVMRERGFTEVREGSFLPPSSQGSLGLPGAF